MNEIILKNASFYINGCVLTSSSKFNSRRTKTADNNYNNDAYYTGSGEQAIEIKCDDRTCLSGNVADIKPGEHSC